MVTKTKTETENPFPEHEKLRARQYDASLLSGFIDFVSEQGWEIAEWDDKSERLFNIRQRPEEIIGLFLGVDPKKLEQEKREMLKQIRTANEHR